MIRFEFRFGFSLVLSFSIFISSSVVYSYTIFDQRTKQLIHQANAGSKRAQYKLGIAYMSGTSVKYNRDEALKWFRKSAAQKYYKAWYRLGELHYDSKYGIRNYRTSYKWFRMAAINNHGLSQYYVARQLFSGKGVDKKSSEALLWAKRAKKNGVAEAAGLLRKIRKTEIQLSAIVTPVIKNKSITLQKPIKKKTRKINVRKLLYVGQWNQNGEPSIYMPSASNNCVNVNSKIRCTSKRIRAKKSEYTADFRIVSLIANFEPKGQFTIRYRKKYVLILRGDPKQEDKVPGLGFDEKVSKLQCRVLKANRIDCYKPDNSIVHFKLTGVGPT